MNSALKNTLKIGLAGAVIFGIGWAFLILQPVQENEQLSVDVKSSTADILSMSFAERSRTEKFVEALDTLGHEKPRAYDYNGNTMFFSTNLVRETPRQVIELYQRQFVEQGINKTVHLTTPDQLVNGPNPNIAALKDAAENQEIIPYTISKNHFSMGGAQFNHDPDPEASLADQVQIVKQNNYETRNALIECGAKDHVVQAKSPNGEAAARQVDKKIGKASKNADRCTNPDSFSCNQVKQEFERANAEQRRLAAILTANPDLSHCPAMRRVSQYKSQQKLETFESKISSFQSIEAFRADGDAYTTVTAVWSDDALDLRRVRTGHYGFPKDKEDDATLPLCENCRRSWVYRGTGKEDHLATDMVVSPNSISLTSEFYRNDLAQKGWKQSEATPAIIELQRLHGGTELNARWLHFAKDDEVLTLRIREQDTGAHVTSFKTD